MQLDAPGAVGVAYLFGDPSDLLLALGRALFARHLLTSLLFVLGPLAGPLLSRCLKTSKGSSTGLSIVHNVSKRYRKGFELTSMIMWVSCPTTASISETIISSQVNR